MKVAAIITHAFRLYDYRVEIHEVESEDDIPELFKKIESDLLGHFELVAITQKVSLC